MIKDSTGYFKSFLEELFKQQSIYENFNKDIILELTLKFYQRLRKLNVYRSDIGILATAFYVSHPYFSQQGIVDLLLDIGVNCSCAIIRNVITGARLEKIYRKQYEEYKQQDLCHVYTWFFKQLILDELRNKYPNLYPRKNTRRLIDNVLGK